MTTQMDGLTRKEIHKDGLVGVLCTPPGGPAPGVVLLGGSEGGLHADDAALLASHGFAVLALAYFGASGVPRDLVRVPLEYFGTALRFMAEQDSVRGNRCAVMGGSFGGMTALLVGATFPGQVSAVVSIAGGGVVLQGIDTDGDFWHMIDTEVPPYTWRGEPLPFIANPSTAEMRRQAAAGEPVALRPAFERGMEDTARLQAATIAVERIQSPVLLISGGDDQQIPAEALNDIAMNRLADGRHLRFPEAGHGICVPPAHPMTETDEQGPGVRLALGGTPEATVTAQHEVWRAAVAFLSD
ncbi:acyl-CoA thioester hydrolase/BAAT C-terminal domain-containing protein [Kutzneria chonburiensis]|uniref:Acyl-CoA thioester hydrolase/BAAT C-terminal domain-containing protein n=1 Tax=Kutzneria chonburiensis TaxID=1483604 RepID=A0ABV6MYH6_9PSEU|nr:acyl-CoA thioester hydrolase/BAAT C-terminal domain-containing protein [Kutzneria chonburiensis]